jgi:tRNA G37 N-methylase TrmD
MCFVCENLTGIAERLDKEVNPLARAGGYVLPGGRTGVRVICPPERKYSNW